jgi:hypothetical protein
MTPCTSGSAAPGMRCDDDPPATRIRIAQRIARRFRRGVCRLARPVPQPRPVATGQTARSLPKRKNRYGGACSRWCTRGSPQPGLCRNGTAPVLSIRHGMRGKVGRCLPRRLSRRFQVRDNSGKLSSRNSPTVLVPCAARDSSASRWSASMAKRTANPSRPRFASGVRAVAAISAYSSAWDLIWSAERWRSGTYFCIPHYAKDRPSRAIMGCGEAEYFCDCENWRSDGRAGQDGWLGACRAQSSDAAPQRWCRRATSDADQRSIQRLRIFCCVLGSSRRVQ